MTNQQRDQLRVSAQTTLASWNIKVTTRKLGNEFWAEDKTSQ
jgi:hypothetical protein